MFSSVKHFCTICRDKRISKRAVTWCTECEVLFCEDCKKPHSRSRLLKNHKTMSSEDYHKLPTFMQEKSSQCRDHKKKFELYCAFHACPCCVQCVTNKHHNCQDMKLLSDIIKEVKSSASVQLFEKDLKDVKENLDAAIKYLKTRISAIHSQKTKSVEDIRYMRKSINDYLNKLEHDVLNDLESKHAKLKLNIASLLQQLEQRASQINQLQSQFTKMTQYATELQMYVGLREIEKTTSQVTNYIEDLNSGDHFSEKNLEVIISSALQSILKDVKSFGDIDINTASSTLEIKAGRKDQAQKIIFKVPGIEEIKPFLLTRLTNPEDRKILGIYGCHVLPDGKFLILNYVCGELLLFSKDGIFIRFVIQFMSGDPFNSCLVSKNTVAVTLGSDNKTILVDIENNEIIETIELSHYCDGVASDGEILVISSCISPSFCTRVNLNDMSHTILAGIEGVDRISMFQGNIYGTMYIENKICCFKSTGEPLWTFQHKDINRPMGITLDNNSYVYIASEENNCVVVVSPDGKTCKTILSEADGIMRPSAIDIHKETGTMIVSSTDYGYAFVYTV